ncbi:CPP1-like family protein [Cyanobium sp. Morenito 9A2]|uniref:CPP1-like family protein n=1 Tax=Cyanobium sp. Morenito 9A2 TaxID=2823718 RepID=UPI0020CF5627|nr:CPP1-like family protein [Cyanobium sp. Morenito 9A2]MCP9848643.1 CPP1-like family protein [Cyanobium sp. Morenito 9A2]
MNQASDQPSHEAGAPGPYQRLGITPEASFDEVQNAKQARLDALGNDPQARALIEGAYDAVLMDRLKERQQGKVSSAALNASQREAARPTATAPSRPALPALPSLPRLPAGRFSPPRFTLPQVELAEGRERWFPLAADGLLLALLVLAPSASPELLLALATGVGVINLQRRNGRFLAAVGWSFALLSLGLVLGALLLSVLPSGLPLGLPLNPLQLQALPALVVLLIGALLIA